MKKTFNENKNYYALLGVSETASKDTLDKVIGDIARNSFNGQKLSNFQEDMLAELWEAYNVLSNSTTRKEYDLARKKKNKNNKTTETETPVQNASVKENKTQTEDIEQKDIAEFANAIANNLTQTFEDEYECDEENDLEDDNNPTEEDLDEVFICGGKTTTPDVKDINPKDASAWVYLKIFIFFILAYIPTRIGFINYGNDNFLPALVMLGAFAMPVTVLIFFFEINLSELI